jgi:Spy/CpxP family protein refolding chaperone
LTIKPLLLTTILSIAPLAAQQTPGIPRPVPQSPLRQHLALTDAQMAGLQQVQTQRRQAESQIYQQISERQRQIDALLREGSNDAVTLGRLMVEVNNLRRQLPLPSAQYRAAALAVLNDAQKAKLPALAEALKLAQPANEAAYYDLIDRPSSAAVPMPRPLPALMRSATLDSEP